MNNALFQEYGEKGDDNDGEVSHEQGGDEVTSGNMTLIISWKINKMALYPWNVQFQDHLCKGIDSSVNFNAVRDHFFGNLSESPAYHYS